MKSEMQILRFYSVGQIIMIVIKRCTHTEYMVGYSYMEAKKSLQGNIRIMTVIKGKLNKNRIMHD